MNRQSDIFAVCDQILRDGGILIAQPPFERASTTRHKYLTLVPDGDTGDYLLKLNLQIRFNR